MAKGLSYVLAVTLITWLGLFLYLLRLDLSSGGGAA